ncbi:MAG: 50S ribosomal protein L9 [Planctomycetaceae bacterium]|nr:50S ribosomal protein L9 [Planctomycetaceae bacterium]
MKVLLLEDVEKLGWLGDVLEVKNGYARNYLLPQGLATVPTEANIKAIAEEKTKRAEIRMLQRKEKEQLAASLEGAEVVVAAKTNELGHLFGSITEREIADNLRAQGFAVKDDMVVLPNGNIKEVGSQDVAVKIASDLRPSVRVTVVSQDESVEAAQQETTPEA